MEIIPSGTEKTDAAESSTAAEIVKKVTKKSGRTLVRILGRPAAESRLMVLSAFDNCLSDRIPLAYCFQ